MKFLVDAQLPPFLAEWLRTRGHEAVHVETIGLRDSDDAEIRVFAHMQGMIIVTKDRDFVVAQPADESPPVIWVRTGNVSNQVLIERFNANWTAVENYLAQGFSVVEIR